MPHFIRRVVPFRFPMLCPQWFSYVRVLSSFFVCLIATPCVSFGLFYFVHVCVLAQLFRYILFPVRGFDFRRGPLVVVAFASWFICHRRRGPR